MYFHDCAPWKLVEKDWVYELWCHIPWRHLVTGLQYCFSKCPLAGLVCSNMCNSVYWTARYSAKRDLNQLLKSIQVETNETMTKKQTICIFVPFFREMRILLYEVISKCPMLFSAVHWDRIRVIACCSVLCWRTVSPSYIQLPWDVYTPELPTVFIKWGL